MKKSLLLMLACILGFDGFIHAQEFGAPADPTNLLVKYDPVSGNAIFTWDAPQTDVDGVSIPKECLIYQVYNSNGGNAIAIVNEPRFERFEATNKFPSSVQYSVRAGSAKDVTQTSTIQSGKVVQSDYLILSPTTKLPICESYNQLDGNTAYDVEYNFSSNEMTGTGNIVSASNDKTYTGVTSSDDDNGYIAMLMLKNHKDIKLVSRFFTLENTTNPVFHFDVLHRGIIETGKMWDGIVNIEVQEEGETTWTQIYSWKEDSETQKWIEVEASLSKYIGKTVRVQLRAVLTEVAVSFMIDNLRIYDKVEKNLALSYYKYPENMDRFKNHKFSIRVHNVGDTDVDKYKVVLYCNDKPIKSVDGKKLLKNRSTRVDFDVTPDALYPQKAEYYVKIECEGDMIDYDNTSEKINISMRNLGRPIPENLHAQSSNDGVRLSWNSPDLNSGVIEPVTESFENLELFEYRPDSFGEWKTYDADGGLTALNATDVNGPNILVPKAFMVFSDKVHGYGITAAASGTKYIAAAPLLTSASSKGDWLISPALSGDAQTVKFKARTNVSKSTETYTVMYSTETDAIEDFKQLETTNRTLSSPTEWKEESIELPKGTRYFAIVSNTKSGKSLFCVDDITYIPQKYEPGLELIGYNIYKNGEKINDAPVTNTNYTDSAQEKGENIYSVSAVFNTGEGATCEAVATQVGSGVESILGEDILQIGYYSLTGLRVNEDCLVPGEIYIKRVTYSSGESKVTKVMIK